jgi:type VII secretion-associated serine protease mycosin
MNKLAGRIGTRVSAVCAALGAVAALSTGAAPGAVAADVQSKQWYLDAMGAQDLWKVSTGEGIKVAVIDSGVNPSTPSLKGQVLVDEVVDSVSYQATTDWDGHGTTMAEIIAGTGAGGGIKGLAPDAKIIPYRAVNEENLSKAEEKKTPELSTFLRAVADSDVKIINMSMGSPYYDDGIKQAAVYAVSKGKLIFASTGNEGHGNDQISFPAGYPGVVGVAASDRNGKVGKFSNEGMGVDLAAPGLDIPGWCDATFRSYCDGQDGTSFSAAVASGAAALIWGAHPDWTANQVLRVLIDTAGRDWPKESPSNYLGYGLIRPGQVLLDGKGNPGPPDVAPLTSTGQLNVNASKSPAPSPSSSPSKTTAEKEAPTSGGTAAATSADSSESNTQLWVIVGVVAVVALGGATFALLRKRRTS